MSKQFKSQREKPSGEFGYLGPWAGYGEKLENGAITEEQKKMLEQAEEKKQIKIE